MKENFNKESSFSYSVSSATSSVIIKDYKLISPNMGSFTVIGECSSCSKRQTTGNSLQSVYVEYLSFLSLRLFDL